MGPGVPCIFHPVLLLCLQSGTPEPVFYVPPKNEEKQPVRIFLGWRWIRSKDLTGLILIQKSWNFSGMRGVGFVAQDKMFYSFQRGVAALESRDNRMERGITIPKILSVYSTRCQYLYHRVYPDKSQNVSQHVWQSLLCSHCFQVQVMSFCKAAVGLRMGNSLSDTHYNKFLIVIVVWLSFWLENSRGYI